MSDEQVEIVRQCFLGIEEEPPRVYVEFFDEGVEIRNPPEFPLRGPFHGHEGVHRWAAQVWEVIEGLHHVIEEIVEAEDGKTVVSVQETQGRMRHTQLPADFRWATVWTFSEGKVVRAEGYMNPADAFKAAGLGN